MCVCVGGADGACVAQGALRQAPSGAGSSLAAAWALGQGRWVGPPKSPAPKHKHTHTHTHTRTHAPELNVRLVQDHEHRQLQQRPQVPLADHAAVGVVG